MAAIDMNKFPSTEVSQSRNPLKISALFFDLDNTLIPTRKGDSKACRKLSEELERTYGFSQDEASKSINNFLQSFRRCPDNPQTSLDSWRSYLWREALPDRYKNITDKIYNRWLHLRYRYLAIPSDYINMLQQFRSAGYLLALITNGPSNAQWEKVTKLNVSQYFDCVLVSSDLPWEKPDPHIFFAACNYLCVKPIECAMVGDKLETDIKGGKLAKLGVTVWIPLNPNEDAIHNDDDIPIDSRPDIIVGNLLEMQKYFPINCGNGSGGNNNIISNSIISNINSSSSNSSSNNSSSSTSSNSSSSSGSSGYNTSLGHRFQQRRNTSQLGILDWPQQQQQQHHLNQQHHQQQQHQQQQQHNRSNRYRRGFSLPDIDYSSENSSDSVFG